MNERAFDAFTPAAAVQRRRSLLLLGGAGLAATLARLSAAPAAKKAKKTCNKEKKQCRRAVQEECARNQSCLDSFLRCCDTCKVGQSRRSALNPPPSGHPAAALRALGPSEPGEGTAEWVLRTGHHGTA